MPDLPVADTEATAARAAELGGTLVVAAEIPAIGRFAVLTDAEGMAFAVSQPG
jgi:predicted enzyme related to lactoylglutathione lyase